MSWVEYGFVLLCFAFVFWLLFCLDTDRDHTVRCKHVLSPLTAYLCCNADPLRSEGWYGIGVTWVSEVSLSCLHFVLCVTWTTRQGEKNLRRSQFGTAVIMLIRHRLYDYDTFKWHASNLEAFFLFIYFNVNPLRDKILVTNRDEFLNLSLTFKIRSW